MYHLPVTATSPPVAPRGVTGRFLLKQWKRGANHKTPTSNPHPVRKRHSLKLHTAKLTLLKERTLVVGSRLTTLPEAIRVLAAPGRTLPLDHPRVKVANMTNTCRFEQGKDEDFNILVAAPFRLIL